MDTRHGTQTPRHTQTDTKGSGVAAGRESEGEGLKGAHADERVGRDGVLQEDAHQVLAHPAAAAAAAAGIGPALRLRGIPKVPPTSQALPLCPPRAPRCGGEGGGTARLHCLDGVQSSSTNLGVRVAQRNAGQDQGPAAARTPIPSSGYDGQCEREGTALCAARSES